MTEDIGHIWRSNAASRDAPPGRWSCFIVDGLLGARAAEHLNQLGVGFRK